jgi:uncharacterized membrane protein YeaQ/YmgE (transglycosylase-associated protein family)
VSIIAWIVLGLIAGFIAAKIVNKKGAGFFLDIVLGIVGALVGGLSLRRSARAGVPSACVAPIAAVLKKSAALPAMSASL